MGYAKRCVCGAVTIDVNGIDISMPYSEFKETYPDVKLEKGKYCNCNYCVNHWGTNLCKCGSGKKKGKCNCGSNQSSALNGRRKMAWG
jgi:hypothetical protein